MICRLAWGFDLRTPVSISKKISAALKYFYFIKGSFISTTSWIAVSTSLLFGKRVVHGRGFVCLSYLLLFVGEDLLGPEHLKIFMLEKGTRSGAYEYCKS